MEAGAVHGEPVLEALDQGVFTPGPERQKWQSTRRNFVPGDLVIIVDEAVPLNSWLTGRVVQAVPDKRGPVRQVRIKTKTSCLDRPITKVCLLQETEEL